METGVPFSMEINPTTIGTLPEMQLTNIEHVETYHLNNNFVAIHAQLLISVNFTGRLLENLIAVLNA